MKHSVRVSRLSAQIFLLILAVLIIPFTAMLLYVRFAMEDVLRNELAGKVTENFSKSEIEINQLFARMLNISTAFSNNTELSEVFVQPDSRKWDRSAVFERIIKNISLQNLFDYMLDDIRITLMDNKGDLYASWSMDYTNYDYLFEQDWVRQSKDTHGYVVWERQALGYGGEAAAQHDQIALARSIINYHDNRRLGTVLITVDQQKLCRLLGSYKYTSSDAVFATGPDGEFLFSDGLLPEAELRRIALAGDAAKSGTVMTVGGRRYLLGSFNIDSRNVVGMVGIKLYCLIDYDRLDRQISKVVFQTNVVCVVFVVLVLLIATVISQQIARPIRQLAGHMRQYRVGDRPVLPQTRRQDEIGDIYGAYENMALHINELFEKLRLEQETREKYYYESLRSKMSPHFLFNTLNSIRWMAVIRKAENIQRSVDDLAEILKYSLMEDEETVPLRRELDVISSYCNIQNVRFGDNCKLALDIPQELEDTRIIKFILQPAVENCFKHAFPNRKNGAVIRITAREEAGVLLVWVCDNGVGFPPDYVQEFESLNDRGGHGIGLKIVNRRIRVSYGEAYGVTLENGPEGGATVVYRLPAAREENQP